VFDGGADVLMWSAGLKTTLKMQNAETGAGMLKYIKRRLFFLHHVHNNSSIC
jgi:hypothetical protein